MIMTEVEATKICIKCRQEKLMSMFSICRREKDGHQFWCKECRETYNQICKAKIAKYNKEYEREHKVGRAKYKSEYAKKRNQSFPGRITKRFCTLRYRCNNSKAANYARYGGKGIKCLFEDVNDFTNHIIDLGITTVKELSGLDIHRIDPAGNYCRGNIMFLPHVKHARLHRGLK